MIDAEKMAAYVNGEAGGGEMPPEEEGNPEEGGQQGTERLANLILRLQESAEDVADVSDEMDAGVLADPMVPMESDDVEILQSGFDGLDSNLKKELTACCAAGGLSIEDARYIAQHLADMELVENPERIAGWLYRIGEMLGGKTAPSEEEEGSGYSVDMGDIPESALTSRWRAYYEPGVVEKESEQLLQAGRGYMDGAFDGATPIGTLKGNRSAVPESPARPLTGDVPFTNLRGGSR
jgi:hypothetical protein